MNQANKQHELTINISPQSRGNIMTNTTFFSMDVNTGKKIINFVQNNAPVDLTNATVMLGFEFIGTSTSKIIDSKDGSVVIEDAQAGICSVILPNHLYDYEGQVLIHVYITYEDGRSLDCGVIVTEFEASWLDRELEGMSDFYVKRFEDLARDVQTRADDLQKLLEQVGDTGTCQCPAEFDLSMLAGSGVLHSEDIDVSNQRIGHVLTKQEITRSGEKWAFDLYDEAHHNSKYWGGLELTSEQPRNLAKIWSHDYYTGIPSLLPVDIDHKPPLKFYVHVINRLTWDIQAEEIVIDDYNVLAVTTVQGNELYKLSGSLAISKLNHLPINYEMVIGGLINYYDRNTVYNLGFNEYGYYRSSLMLYALTEIPDDYVVVFGGGSFETEYKEWTTTVTDYTEVLSFDRTFATDDRVSFAANVKFDIHLENWSGREGDVERIEFNFLVSNIRVGEEVLVMQNYKASESNWIPSAWGEVIVILTEKGVYFRWTNHPILTHWNLPFEGGDFEITRLDVTRRL